MRGCTQFTEIVSAPHYLTVINSETATLLASDPTLESAIPAQKSKSNIIMRYLPAVIRVLLGLFLLLAGLNGLFHFLPEPTPQIPERAMAFAEALMKTGYMLQLIAITQTIVGALLVTNRFVPLALALFAPFIVNAVAFHLFLEPSGRVTAFIFLALELYLAWHYRKAFRPMLAAKAKP